VKPKSEPGVTLRFVPSTPALPAEDHSKAKQFEQSSPYEKTLVTLLKAVMLHQTPSGYSTIASSALSKIALFTLPKQSAHTHGLSEKVVAGFLGNALAVRVIQVTNDSNHSMTLQASDFYTPGVRAVALSHEFVPAHHISRLYEVLRDA
jgi:hypothetical protein